ncbi:MAG: hypothetical protein RMM30_11730 [Armatimonadota bacterium]|nr:hypothetical protein [Armatimonadota bacterium]MDW8157241.1 hypothetical protein [Armatimonadota bacterium]
MRATSRGLRVLWGLPGMTPAMLFPTAAAFFLVCAGVGVVVLSGPLAVGRWRAYPALAATHLLTLGWGTLVAMGALHQMFPAVLGISAKPGRGTVVHLAVTLAAAFTLPAAFLAGSPPWVAAGGVLMVASVVLLLAHLAQLVPRRRRWPPSATGVLLSVAYLFWTVVWGALMALNWNLQFWPALYTYLGVGVHAAVGLVGWFVQLVVAVSYYLLPRFTGVRHVSERRVVPVLWALNLSVASFVLAAATGQALPARVGTVVLGGAALAYAADVSRFLRGARQTVPDLTNWHWWAMVGQTALGGAAGLLWTTGLLSDGRRLAAATAILVLCGWVTLAIMGQLYKVTPFLMWYYRFARGLSAYEVPRLPAPYFPRWGVAAFALTATGSTLLWASVLAALPTLAQAAAAVFAAGCAVYAGGAVASWVVAVLLRPPRGSQTAPAPRV